MRRLRLYREPLTELTADALTRVVAGTPTDQPSCVHLLCAISGTGCESILEPCHQTSQCSVRCP